MGVGGVTIESLLNSYRQNKQQQIIIIIIIIIVIYLFIILCFRVVVLTFELL